MARPWRPGPQRWIGTHVILWKKVERGDAAAEAGGEGDSRARFFARSFVVFNRDQVDGAEDTPEKEVAPISTSVADALAFLEGLGVPVEYGLHAYYRPSTRSSCPSARLSTMTSTLCPHSHMRSRTRVDMWTG
jgi:antirestriction protein ArdC